MHCLQVDTDSAPDLVNYLVGVSTNTTRLGAVLFTSLKLRAPPGTYTLPFRGTPVGGWGRAFAARILPVRAGHAPRPAHCTAQSPLCRTDCGLCQFQTW